LLSSALALIISCLDCFGWGDFFYDFFESVGFGSSLFSGSLDFLDLAGALFIP